VDDDILIEQIEKRIKETKAKGHVVRAADDPVVLKQRAGNYQKQTAPLSDYYRREGLLVAIDGMRGIERVEADIEQRRNHGSC
jgi:adenylate kinase